MAMLMDLELTPPMSAAAASSFHHPAAAILDAVAPAPAVSAMVTTTAVTREFDDLDPRLFAAFSMLATGIRTAFLHPMTITLARKQAVPHLATASTRSILTQMLRNEGGWRALTRGMGITVCAIAANETLANLTYEWSRSAAPFETDLAKESAGGFVSDALGRSVSTPMGLVANRQMIAGVAAAMTAGAGAAMVAETAHRSALHHTKHILRREGLRGLSAGLGLSLFYGGLWSAAWWPVYCDAKRRMYDGWSHTVEWANNADVNTAPTQQHSPSRHFAASPPLGAVALGHHDVCGIGKYRTPQASETNSWSMRHLVRAGIAAMPESMVSTTDNLLLNGTAAALSSGATAVIFNPCLVIMTRLQVNPGSSLRGVCRSIVAEQGWRGFTAGTMLNVSACIVDGVLSASCYEWARQWSDRSLLRNATTTSA